MKKIITVFILLISFQIGYAQTGIGTTTPINKFQVETAAVAPATSGATANGHLRLGVPAANQVLDVGLGSTFGWMQARDKSNYATNSILAINPNGGNVGIGTTAPTVRLQVNGDIIANSIGGSSDIRFKKNIKPIKDALAKTLQLQGVYFHWNQAQFPERDFSTKTEMGFIAQEVEKVIPEVVSQENNEQGYRAVKYDKIVALLVEAIKEQQLQIDSLKVQLKKINKSKK